VLLLAPILLAAAPQQDLPKNDGWVTDLAGVLQGAQEQSLETLMESYKQGSGHDVAVLVIPALEGRSLETLSLEVARGWGLGGEETHDGALLLVSVQDRKMRIEVGRGLEGTLTDAIAGRIIRDVIAPELRRGDWYGGISEGVRAMQAASGGDYAAIDAKRRDGPRWTGLCSLGFVLFFVLINVLAARSRHGGYRGSGGRGAFWTWVMLSALSSSGRGGGRSGGLGGGGGGFSGFGGGGGFSGGGSSGGW